MKDNNKIINDIPMTPKSNNNRNIPLTPGSLPHIVEYKSNDLVNKMEEDNEDDNLINSQVFNIINNLKDNIQDNKDNDLIESHAGSIVNSQDSFTGSFYSQPSQLDIVNYKSTFSKSNSNSISNNNKMEEDINLESLNENEFVINEVYNTKGIDDDLIKSRYPNLKRDELNNSKTLINLFHFYNTINNSISNNELKNTLLGNEKGISKLRYNDILGIYKYLLNGLKKEENRNIVRKTFEEDIYSLFSPDYKNDMESRLLISLGLIKRNPSMIENKTVNNYLLTGIKTNENNQDYKLGFIYSIESRNGNNRIIIIPFCDGNLTKVNKRFEIKRKLVTFKKLINNIVLNKSELIELWNNTSIELCKYFSQDLYLDVQFSTNTLKNLEFYSLI